MSNSPYIFESKSLPLISFEGWTKIPFLKLSTTDNIFLMLLVKKTLWISLKIINNVIKVAERIQESTIMIMFVFCK
jgi:hypothetical protein